MSLESLPAEVLNNILYRTSPASHLAVNLASHTLYTATRNVTRRVREELSMVDLLELEEWPRYDGARYREPNLKQPIHGLDFFGCSYCLRLRSAGKFSNAMMKGRRGKHGLGTVAERLQRFCISCGVKQGRYQRGTYMQYGGAFGGYGFVCLKCGRFTIAKSGLEFEVAQRTCAHCCTAL